MLVENKIVEAEATQALQLNPKGGLVSIGGDAIVVVKWRDPTAKSAPPRVTIARLIPRWPFGLCLSRYGR